MVFVKGEDTVAGDRRSVVLAVVHPVVGAGVCALDQGVDVREVGG